MELMEFDIKEAKSSSEKLAEGLNKFEEQIGKVKKDEERFALTRQAINYIGGFPVPSNKEDLIDFIISLDAQRKRGIYSHFFKLKWKEAMKKAKLLFPDDPQIATLTTGLNKKTILEKIIGLFKSR